MSGGPAEVRLVSDSVRAESNLGIVPCTGEDPEMHPTALVAHDVHGQLAIQLLAVDDISATKHAMVTFSAHV